MFSLFSPAQTSGGLGGDYFKKLLTNIILVTKNEHNMKKILRYALMSVFALFSIATMAEGTTTIGATDNSTAWWTIFSDWYTIAPNKTLTLTFVNHSSKTDNWNNWASEIVSAESNYEWLVMRADCFGVSNGGWGDDGMNTNNNLNNWFNCNFNNYNWDTFKDDLDGATVQLTVQRNGDFLTLIEDVTTADGTGKYRHYFSMYCVADNNVDLKIRLTVDHAHIVLNNDYDYKDTVVPAVEGTVVGALDNSTGWWTAFSDYYTLAPNQTQTLKFKNYSSKAQNFHNWILGLCNDADRGTETYVEHMILRADNYGWGTKWDAANITSNYNWDTFKNDLDGALIEMTIAREDAKVTVTAVQTPAAGGSALTETYTYTDDANKNNTIRAFLSTEGGHLDILSAGTDGIEAVKTMKAENGVRYNLAGQKVGSDFKGVVIENGKKLVVR